MFLDIIVLLARIVVGGVFLIVGFAKIKLPSNQFLNAILGYDLTPKLFATILARWLPWLEVTVGGLLLVGLLNHIGAISGFILLIIFSGVVISSLVRGKTNECGCSNSLTPVKWQLVYRNMGLMGLLLLIIAQNGGILALDRFFEIEPGAFFSNVISVLTIFWVGISFFSLFMHILMQHRASQSANS